MPPSFSSPWGDAPGTLHRVQADVPAASVRYLQSLSPGPGIMINIIQSVFYALEHDCRNAGFTCWTPETHAALVGFIRDRTSTRAPSDQRDRHVPRTVETIRTVYEVVANKSADVQQDPSSRGRQRGTRRSAGNGKKAKGAE